MLLLAGVRRYIRVRDGADGMQWESDPGIFVHGRHWVELDGRRLWRLIVGISILAPML